MNTAIGYQALVEFYNLSVIPHYRRSYITAQRASIQIDNNQEIHLYQKSYALKDPKNVFSQLEFAIKYDGINLEILEAVFEQIHSEEIEGAIKMHPSSKYLRMIWFLYEYLTEERLDIPDVKKLQYVNLLDPELYFTSKGIKSPRHYVYNNLIGFNKFCPIIRKTKTLLNFIEKEYDQKVRAMAGKYDPQILARASHYLYTKETLSSYEIEREKPNKERMARFISILQRTNSIEKLTKAQLIELQNVIVEPRFKDSDYRIQQNYVGESTNHYLQRIHYISPKPEDVNDLMSGWLNTLEKSLGEGIHPVLVATMISFGFVFIHPFEDGNGRIHRFLIHYILSREKFTPPGIIFPISAVMLQNMHEYDQILELFSKPLMNQITQYDLSDEGTLTVNQTTLSYYKYIDYTKMAEYLFSCIDKTMHEHFEKELEFLIKYDQTKREIQGVIDMPDKLIDLFIKFAMQNHGNIGQQKRIKFFDKLRDDEIEKLESIVKLQMLETSKK